MKCVLLFLMLSVVNINMTAQIQIVNSQTTDMLVSLHSIDTVVYIAGSYDYVAKCAKGCDQIIPLNLSGLNYQRLTFSPVSADTIYALSTNYFPHNALFFQSNDGGANWILKWDTSGVFMDYLTMFNSKDGFIPSTSHKAFKTNNAGLTWHYVSNPLIIISAKSKLNDSTLGMGISERFCISYNKGEDWTCNSFVQSNPRDFHFLSDSVFYAVSAGATGRYFSFSMDAGKNWVDQTIFGIDPYGVYFVDEKEGYIIGRNDTNYHGLILKTTDSGQTWIPFYTNITTTLSDMIFLNDSIALVCGTQGVLFKWNKNSAFTSGLPLIESRSSSNMLYPNPVTGDLVLELKTKTISIEIADVSGRVLFFKEIRDQEKITLDVSGFTTGLYVIRYQLPTGEWQQDKFLKQ